MISIKSFGNATEPQAARIQGAVSIWDRVWQTEDFRQAVLNFRGGPNSYGFTQQNKTNHVVYETIMAHFQTGLEVRYAINQVPNGSETATTNVSSGLTLIESSWINTSTLYQLVDTLSHEFCHTPQGGCFKHSYLSRDWKPPFSLRANSAPYGIGNITAVLAKKLVL